MSHDSNRTRIWFPMFSYFESSVDGIIPNEYDSLEEVMTNIFSWITCVKDCSMLTARRFWVAHNHQFAPVLPPKARLNSLFGGKSFGELLVSSAVDSGKAIEHLDMDLVRSIAEEVTKNTAIETSSTAPTTNTPSKVKKLE